MHESDSFFTLHVFVISYTFDREVALISIVLLSPRPRPEFKVKDEHNVFDGINTLEMPSGKLLQQMLL